MRILRFLSKRFSAMPHGQYSLSLYFSENRMEINTFIILKIKNITNISINMMRNKVPSDFLMHNI